MANSTPTRGIEDLAVWADCLPPALHAELLEALSLQRFRRWHRTGFPFHRTTFWYPLNSEPSHVVERSIEVLREAVRPSPQIIGVEWWLTARNTNDTPQWLLKCHFDQHDIDEADPSLIRHPEWASVFFFNEVPYGELVITDQVLGPEGLPTPSEPLSMRFVPPGLNRYAVFPGHLHHGVIGRMWRPWEEDRLRMTMAVNWWTERPKAPYLRESSEAPAILGLGSPVPA